MSVRVHRMRVRAGVPALVLRGALLVLSVLAVGMLDAPPLWFGVAVATAVAGAVLPWTMAAWAPIAGIVLALLMVEPSPGRTAFALFAAHLIHVLAGICWAIPWQSRVHPAVLWPSIRRFGLWQLLVQPCALAVGLLPRVTGPGYDWLAPLGAVVLVVIVVLMRRGHDDVEA